MLFRECCASASLRLQEKPQSVHVVALYLVKLSRSRCNLYTTYMCVVKIFRSWLLLPSKVLSFRRCQSLRVLKEQKILLPSDFSYEWRTGSSKFFFSFGFSIKREIPFVSKKWYLNPRSVNCTQVQARDISASETGWRGASTEILSVPRKFCEGRTYWSTLKVDERYNGVFTTALTVFPVIK